jgi:hypothetical protein
MREKYHTSSLPDIHMCLSHISLPSEDHPWSLALLLASHVKCLRAMHMHHHRGKHIHTLHISSQIMHMYDLAHMIHIHIHVTSCIHETSMQYLFCSSNAVNSLASLTFPCYNKDSNTYRCRSISSLHESVAKLLPRLICPEFLYHVSSTGN